MFRKIVHRTAFAAALAGVLAGCSADTPAEPSADEPAVIGERQDNFEAIGDAFKLIRGELDKEAPDLAVIGTQAGEINTRAKAIEGKFPEGTSLDDGYDTEALATIWEKPEEFAAARQKLIEESEKLATIAGEGDAAAVGAQVKAMGGSCKNCHDQFRVDDD